MIKFNILLIIIISGFIHKTYCLEKKEKHEKDTKINQEIDLKEKSHPKTIISFTYKCYVKAKCLCKYQCYTPYESKPINIYVPVKLTFKKLKKIILAFIIKPNNYNKDDEITFCLFKKNGSYNQDFKDEQELNMIKYPELIVYNYLLQ